MTIVKLGAFPVEPKKNDVRVSNHRYIYKEKVDLAEVFEQSHAAYTHVFCDVLTWDPATTALASGPRIWRFTPDGVVPKSDRPQISKFAPTSLHVYARLLQPSSQPSGVSDLLWTSMESTPFRAAFFYEHIAGRTDSLSWQVWYSGSNSCQVDLPIRAGAAPGWAMEGSSVAGKDQIVTRAVAIPPTLLQGARPEAAANIADGDYVAVVQQVLKTSYISGLAHHILGMALDNVWNSQPSGIETARNQAMFVLRLTRATSDLAALSRVAQGLVDILDAPARYPSPYGSLAEGLVGVAVPPLAVAEYVKMLDTCNKQMQTKESWIQAETLHRNTSLIIEGASADQLTAISSSMQSTSDLGALREKVYLAYKHSQTCQQEMKKRENSVRQAIEQCKKAQEEYRDVIETQAIIDITLAIAELVITVGVAIATFGESAPLTAASFANVEQTIAAEAKTLSKVAGVAKKLAKDTPALGAKIFSSGKWLQVINDTSGTRSPLSAGPGPDGDDGGLEIDPIDYLDIMERWAEQQVDIEAMCKDMRDAVGSAAGVSASVSVARSKVLEAVNNYEAEMKKAFLRGQAVLEMQRVVSDAYAKYMEEKRVADVRNKRRTAVDALRQKIGTRQALEAADYDSLVGHLEDEVLLHRLDASILVIQCAAAIMYKKGSGNLDPAFKYGPNDNAMKCASVKEHLETASKDIDVEHRNNQNTGSDMVVVIDEKSTPLFTQLLRPSTGADEHGSPTVIPADNRIPFAIPYSHPVFDTWRHLRVKNVRAVLSYMDDKGGVSVLKDINYTISLGPHVMDKFQAGDKYQSHQYWLSPCQITKWSMEEVSVDSVSADWQNAEFAVPAPSCSGSISFEPLAKASDSPSEQEKARSIAYKLIPAIVSVRIIFTCTGIHD